VLAPTGDREVIIHKIPKGYSRMKQTRKQIGASLSQMANLIGIPGPNGADSIRGIEYGKRVASGPMQKVLGYMNRGHHDLLPKYMICDDIESDSTLPSWIFHTQYPRFLAIFDLVDSTVLFIDEPLEQESKYWNEAVREIRKHLL
jgi:hypothetical protein